MPRPDPRRVAPTAIAAGLAAAYVIVSPPSLDLAAHLFRAKLFEAEGFGLWNNWWYAGHDVPGYSILFPPLAAALSPQLVGAIGAVASAVLFERLAFTRFGPEAWLGSVWFGAATASSLFSGRLTFAFGMLPAVATALALQRRRAGLAAAVAFLTALASPVAALFAALAGAAYALGGHKRVAGLAVVIAALAPVALLAIAFPEGGTFPFAFSALWPLLVIAALALPALPRDATTLRAGVAMYALGCVVAYALPTPIGANAARLGTLVAGPLAALILIARHRALLLVAALPLLYLQWEPPIRDLVNGAGDASASASYYAPLLRFLARQSVPPTPPFRIEIPATRFHYESYAVAPRYSLARGWERQLDIKYNHLFYGDRGELTSSTYEAWLHRIAVRFVAVSDAEHDYSAVAEQALIERGVSYLRPVFESRHWRVYAVSDPTPIVSGAATLTALGPNSLTLYARRPGNALVRVRFTPYWALGEGAGCVSPAGDFTSVRLRRPGPAKLVIRFSVGRIGAGSPRCT
jgi:hypothetical protein